MASGIVPVRESPDQGAIKVRSLKNGQLVRIDFESEGWVAVFDPEQKKRSETTAWGYARIDQLRLAGALDLPRTPMTSSRAPLGSIEVVKGGQDEESAPAPKKGRAEHAARGNETEAAPARRGESARHAEKDADAPVKPQAKFGNAADSAGQASSRSAKVGSKADKVSIKADKAEAKTGKAAAKADKAAEKASKASAKNGKDGSAKKAAMSRPVTPPKPFGEIRIADRDLAIRSQRTKESEFVTLLRPGQRVRVDFQEDGFYAVFDVDETVRDVTRARGYSRDKYLLTEQEYAEAVKVSPGAPAKSEKQTTEQDAAVKSGKPGKVEKTDKSVAQGKDLEKATELAAKTEKALVKKPHAASNSTHKAEPAVVASPAVESVKASPLPPAQPVSPSPPASFAPAATKKSKEPTQTEAKAEPVAAKSAASGGPVVAYTVLERRADPLRPFAPLVVRVRLDADQPPTGDALRHVVREIWGAEHHGAGEMQLEVFLPGAEANSLAYAVARFAKDGRLRDFLWRESLLRSKN